MVLYNILFFLTCILGFPFFLFRVLTQSKYRVGWKERLGLEIPRDEKNRNVIWIHAVSVGEASAVYPLYRALKEKYSHLKIIFSTTTKTGQEWIIHKLDPGDQAIYFPIDFYPIVKRCLSLIQPKAVIIVETEIWPNFWNLAYQMKIPLMLMNGRMSKRSFKRYKKIKWFIKAILNKAIFISCQTHEDANHYEALGVQRGKIFIGGNLKFETPPINTTESIQLKKELGIQEEPILLGGSTHAGEEEILIDCFTELKITFPDLRLILVPRHPERFQEVETLILKKGFLYFRASQLSTKKWVSHEIFLLDIMGKLSSYYSVATVVFMGKSLRSQGGQNVLEPAMWGKPILFGPHMENFKYITEKFLKENAAIEIQDPEDLKNTLIKLLGSFEIRETLGQNAKHLIEKNKGSLMYHLNTMEEKLTWLR